MRVWIDKRQTPAVLFIEPQTRHERDCFEEFADPDTPLVAVRKKCPGYTDPHVEIRKNDP